MNFRTAKLQVFVDKNTSNATEAELKMFEILRDFDENFTFQCPIRVGKNSSCISNKLQVSFLND